MCLRPPSVNERRQEGSVELSGPSISVILKGDLGFQLIYVKAKDLSSPKYHKVEKDT